MQDRSTLDRKGLYHQALVSFLYQLADDELILGHRDSEWLGVAPDIEEDVAFSSIAQDEVGHAVFYYTLLADLGEGDPDRLSFDRTVAFRRNAILVERPNGDWAHSIVRHYFWDVFEDLRLRALTTSSYAPLAQGAVKIRREEYYHLLHFELYLRRLAMAGGEARTRLQSAVNQLWVDVPAMFAVGPYLNALVQTGILTVQPSALRDQWLQRVSEVLDDVGLHCPTKGLGEIEEEGRVHHTSDLEVLLSTMCEVAHSDENAVW